MTDTAFLLSVLEDGEPHSQAELLRLSFERRNCGLTIHSRVAELRKKGHYIVCDHVPGKKRGEAWEYRLLGSLDEGLVDRGSTAVSPGNLTGITDTDPSSSEPEQLRLSEVA